MTSTTKINWLKVNSLAGSYTSESLAYKRPCPICGSLNSKIVSELNDFQFYSDSTEEPKRFDVRQNMCLKCFTLYLNPCYSKYGFSVLFSEAGQSYGSMSEHTNEQIDWLNNYELLNDGARVLDVGCFDGSFLSRLPNNVTKLGVDIDEPAIERGRQLHKDKEITFFLGDFESFKYDGLAPDTITMYHVLEHLPRPVDVLKNLLSISDSSTCLIVEVPVLDNGNTNDIHGFLTIQHTTHFSRNSLRNCLGLAGWNIEHEYVTPDYNGYRVLAFPQDRDSLHWLLEPAQEDRDDLKSSLSSWVSAIESVEKIIQDIPKSPRFVIWGGGAHIEYLYQLTSLFHAHKQSDFVIVDSDPLKQGKTWRGIPIYNPSIIKKLDWSSTNLLISSYGEQEAIFEAAIKSNVAPSNIYRFYETIRRY